VSLILDALRKLERERDTSGRGFLVVAHRPWAAARGRAARLALAAIGAGALAGASGWLVWNALSSRTPAPPASPAAGTAGARPASPALAPPIWEATPAPARAATVPRPVPEPSAPPSPRSATPATAEPGPGEPPLLVIAPAAPARQATLRLEAISSRDGEPVAVINGRLVRTGDSVDGARVTWIGADAVEVEVEGRRRVVGF
jgi:hypothetical protein